MYWMLFWTPRFSWQSLRIAVSARLPTSTHVWLFDAERHAPDLGEREPRLLVQRERAVLLREVDVPAVDAEIPASVAVQVGPMVVVGVL